MKTRLYIWVTSDCNLKCPYCIQEPVMAKHRGYQMTVDEAFDIVQSCLERGIHFDTIELTGGEASMWKYIKEGMKMFSKIADEVTLATNGNNPELVRSLGMKTWILSASQATKAQMAKYSDILHKLTVNYHRHKKMPEEGLEGVLPSICCTAKNPVTGEAQTTFEYIRGRIWICPDACSHVTRLGLKEEDYSCDFKEDFISKYSHKTYNQLICEYCLGNQKVWSKL